MKIISVPARERFDNTEFTSEIIDGRAHWMNATYTCPSCGVQVGFQQRHFLRRLRFQSTSLVVEVASAFDDFARTHEADVQGRAKVEPFFVDWKCPECSLPVRAYYIAWGGGKGVGGTILTRVFEANDL